MHLVNLNIEEFNTFQQSHPLSNFYQTVNYAMLMAENGYDYELIGLVDQNNNIAAASVILIKPIKGFKCYYGYAPRGFLIDYNNEYLLRTFTEELKKYFLEKDVIFIKLNPNIPIGIVNNKTFETETINNGITTTLIRCGYKKLLDNMYFESVLPRFNAFINLNTFNTEDLAKNTKNKIKKGIRKGLTFELASRNEIDYFYEMVKNKYDNSNYFYQDYYTVFDKNENVDLFLVSIDYDAFLQNSQYIYGEELEKNNRLNEKLATRSSEKIINAKMNSDKILLSYKNDIMEATKGISDQKKIYVAGALVIKHNNMVTICYSGYDQKYKRFAPNYFMHYNIIKYYQNKFDNLDLNGVVGDFKNSNYYHGLNRFKLGFNPQIFEYIGEFDLIIDQRGYDILLRKGILAKEFNKNNENKK